MPKTYTRDQAQAIWDMADKMSRIAEKALREEGWGVHCEWDGEWWCRIEKFIPDPIASADPTGNTPHMEERERSLYIAAYVGAETNPGAGHIKPGEVTFHCRHNAKEEDIPVLLRILAAAMAPLVGPYMVANREW